MSHCCRGCGFSLFWSGYPEDALCGGCRKSLRRTGGFPAGAADKKAQLERESIRDEKLRSRTRQFRDDRRGTDGIP